MVKFELKVNREQKRMYIPKELIPIIGFEPTGIPNAFSVLLFKKDEDMEKVLKSLDIIRRDLELRLENIE